MPDTLYRVAWIATATGYASHGRPLPKADAEAAAERGNREWPSIKHWIEPVANWSPDWAGTPAAEPERT